MKIIHRIAEDRGVFENDWLIAKYSFSFAYYYDKNWMGFGDLIVLNDDIIKPSKGFERHSHKNAEIITYYVDTDVSHHNVDFNSNQNKDFENGIAGDIIYTSAGKGISHEHNFEKATQNSRILQIWLKPDQLDTEPAYDKKNITYKDKLNNLILFASPNGKDKSMQIKQNAFLYTSVIQKNKTIDFIANNKRKYWIQIVKGALLFNGITYKEGDGIGILNANEKLVFEGINQENEFIVFDLIDRSV